VSRAGAHLKLGVAVLAVLLCTPATASALCIWTGGLCNTFWMYDSVFEGTVVSIEQNGPDTSEPTYLRFPYRIVTFDVHRRWRGEPGPRIQLRMTGGPGLWVEDSIDFVVGRRYLVFASRHPEKGYLLTNSCAPTAEVPSKSATDSLAFLTSLSQPAQGGRIFGTVREQLTTSNAWPPVEAMVTIEGQGVRRSMRSVGGSFEFTGLPAGAYTVSVEPPPGMSGRASDTATVPDVRGCAQARLLVKRR
jgi:hypothetical protein